METIIIRICQRRKLSLKTEWQGHTRGHTIRFTLIRSHMSNHVAHFREALNIKGRWSCAALWVCIVWQVFTVCVPGPSLSFSLPPPPGGGFEGGGKGRSHSCKLLPETSSADVANHLPQAGWQRVWSPILLLFVWFIVSKLKLLSETGYRRKHLLLLGK